MRILYLAHDLADAAVRRRVLMLQHGGARVTVAGFQRGASVLADDPQTRTISLGRTQDARFTQRIGAVASARMSLRRRLSGIEAPDVIIARNLEMLALADAAASLFGSGIPIVYECLDIHRLLLDDGVKGKLLRRAEGYFGRKARLLLTSSPAFTEHYFGPRSRLDLPVMLLENKVLDLGGSADAALRRPRPPQAGEPWRIGWFGALRCRKSLAILCDFATRMQGQVEIVLRGRPAYGEFDNFNAQVEAAPHVSFHGAYRNPEDLGAIYSQVQFVWAIDFFEEGLNSDWLLPNRLYEGALHGAIPIALSTTQTGRHLSERGLGLTLASAGPDEFVRRFTAINAASYRDLSAALAATDPAEWSVGPDACEALVARLAALRPVTSLTSTTAFAASSET